MPIGAHFEQIFGILTPKITMLLFYHWKEYNTRRNVWYEILFVKIGLAVWPIAKLENEQKNKEIIKNNTDGLYFTFLWCFRPWADWYIIWRIEWPARSNHLCHIVCRSVSGFPRGRTPKSVIFLYFFKWPSQLSALRCRPWWYDNDQLMLLLAFQVQRNSYWKSLWSGHWEDPFHQIELYRQREIYSWL